jgi:hypothetical protein
MATGGIMASVGYTFYIGLVYFASYSGYYLLAAKITLAMYPKGKDIEWS